MLWSDLQPNQCGKGLSGFWNSTMLSWTPFGNTQPLLPAQQRKVSGKISLNVIPDVSNPTVGSRIASVTSGSATWLASNLSSLNSWILAENACGPLLPSLLLEEKFYLKEGQMLQDYTNPLRKFSLMTRRQRLIWTHQRTSRFTWIVLLDRFSYYLLFNCSLYDSFMMQIAQFSHQWSVIISHQNVGHDMQPSAP